MIDKILFENTEREYIVKGLKERSGYFPDIILEQHKDILYASTLVRVEHDSKWWAVHIVDSIIPNKKFKELLLNIIEKAHLTQFLYIPNGMEDIDDCQLSEQDRLKTITR